MSESKKTTQIEKTCYRNLYIQVSPGTIYPFIPGTIVDVFVEKGQHVTRGQKLLTLHAMKMDNEVCAPIDGTIKKINVSKKQVVSKNDILIEIVR